MPRPSVCEVVRPTKCWAFTFIWWSDWYVTLGNNMSSDNLAIEKNDANTSVFVHNGTELQAISLQQAQALYRELTGKSERIYERYNDSVIVSFENIEQLHRRITQCYTQYNVKSSSTNFSISYDDKSSER